MGKFSASRFSAVHYSMFDHFPVAKSDSVSINQLLSSMQTRFMGISSYRCLISYKLSNPCFLEDMSSAAPVCNHSTSCQAWDIDLQYPEDNFWSCRTLEINVKATFIVAGSEKLPASRVQEERHNLPLDQLLNDAAADDWSDTNIWDVFDSMQIPIQRPTLDKIVGCALGMAGRESYKDRKVLRMRVEIEAVVSEQPDLDEGDAYCIDVEANDFWETVGAFRKLRKVVVEEPKNVCSICLAEFLVGSEITATPCSHVFHDRCIRAWLKKCSKKFCPNCVTLLA